MTRAKVQDVVIVGAGIIGCAIAYALSRRGARVTVLERGRIGGGASGAAAGMLAPQAETGLPPPLFDLAISSRNQYREWVEEVGADAGTSIDFERSGLLHLALDDESAGVLKARGDRQLSLGLQAEWLSGDEAAEIEPDLRPGLAGALFLPDEAQVDAAALNRALAVAARRRGAHIVEHAPVSSVVIGGGRVGVEAGGTRYAASWVVIAAGAWSSRIAGLPLPEGSIEPCRGQIVVVRRGPLRIHHILYTHGAYAVPRANQLLLGTTVERAGFDCITTARGVQSILERVGRFAPEIGAAEVVRLAAGLRPEPQGGLPLIGPIAAIPQLVLATGHFRNGVLLAPITGDLVAEAIAGGRTPPVLAPFLPDRLLQPSDPATGAEPRRSADSRCL